MWQRFSHWGISTKCAEVEYCVKKLFRSDFSWTSLFLALCMLLMVQIPCIPIDFILLRGMEDLFMFTALAALPLLKMGTAINTLEPLNLHSLGSPIPIDILPLLLLTTDIDTKYRE
jgi:hypothetical protein